MIYELLQYYTGIIYCTFYNNMLFLFERSIILDFLISENRMLQGSKVELSQHSTHKKIRLEQINQELS
jgi:hypothetical protein